MTPELITFYVFALVAIATAAGMLLSRNAVYSALFLVLNFVTVAIFYLLLNAPFIALSQVTVYAGAIMVLFLFVIMLLGTEKLDPKSIQLPWQRILSLLLGLVLVGVLSYWFFFRGGLTAAIPDPVETFGDPRSVGFELFNVYLLPFEVTSILLLVAMVGAIILTKKEKKGGQG